MCDTRQDDARARGKWQGMNWIRKEKRLAIYCRDGFACAYCGDSAENGAALSLDHVTPHSQGGTNSEKNLVTCCSRCNSVRQDRSVEDFAAAAAGYVNTDAARIVDYIARQTAQDLKPFRAEADALIARRGSYSAALATR